MDKEHTATACGKDMPISTKHVIEIGSFISGKTLVRAKTLLKGVIAKTVAVPMKKFNMDTGHKTGMSSGSYPQKAAKQVLMLLESAEKNAQNKGLNTEALYIQIYKANKGTTQWRSGRQRRRQAKRSHVEVILAEKEVKKPKAEKKAVVEKQAEAPKEQKAANTKKVEKK